MAANDASTIEYLRAHNVGGIVNKAVLQMLEDKPESPQAWLVQYLDKLMAGGAKKEEVPAEAAAGAAEEKEEAAAAPPAEEEKEAETPKEDAAAAAAAEEPKKEEDVAPAAQAEGEKENAPAAAEEKKDEAKQEEASVAEEKAKAGRVPKVSDIMSRMLDDFKKGGNVWMQPVAFPNDTKKFHYFAAVPGAPEDIVVLRDGCTKTALVKMSADLIGELAADGRALFVNSDLRPIADVDDTAVRDVLTEALANKGAETESKALADAAAQQAATAAEGTSGMAGAPLEGVAGINYNADDEKMDLTLRNGSECEIMTVTAPLEDWCVAKSHVVNGDKFDKPVPFDFLKAVWGNFFEKKFNFMSEQQLFTKDDGFVYVKIQPTARVDKMQYEGDARFDGVILKLAIKE